MFAGKLGGTGKTTGCETGRKGGRTGGARGNQHNRRDESQLTKHQVQKRVWGHLASARAAAPEAAKLKWQEIESRKGVKGGQIQKLKKQFLMAWVGDPSWEDSYFSQSLSYREVDSKKLLGKWITQGRLEQLIGKEETERAIACRAASMTFIA